MTKYLDTFVIEELKEVLEKEGIVAFPTDTVFGLACVYDSPMAIERIKQLKGRDKNKPLPMMCSDIEMLKKVAKTNEAIDRVIKSFCPGALTLILNKKDNIEDYVTNGFKTIGIRIPDEDNILALIKAINKPLLVTSCNISNEPSIKDCQTIKKKFDGIIDIIVYRDAKSSIASTIVDMTKEEVEILREGIIKKEEILEVYYER